MTLSVPFLVKIAPNPVFEASVSRINHLVTLGMTIRVKILKLSLTYQKMTDSFHPVGIYILTLSIYVKI